MPTYMVFTKDTKHKKIELKQVLTKAVRLCLQLFSTVYNVYYTMSVLVIYKKQSEMTIMEQ